MDYIDLIEKYLDGEMSGEELKSFEHRLHVNDDLRQDVKNLKQIQRFLESFSDKVIHFELENKGIEHHCLLDLWDQANTSGFTAHIIQLKRVLQNRIPLHINKWLSQEAILYTELVEQVWAAPIYDSFIKNRLDENEIDLLRERLIEVYGLCADVNNTVEEYLFLKRTNNTDKTLCEQEPAPPEQKVLRPWAKRPWLMTAAAILLVLLATTAVLTYLYFNPSRNERIFAEHYQALSIPIDFRGETNTAVSSFDAGLHAYKAKDYALAVRLLEQVPETNKNSGLALLFTGLSYMESGVYSSAIPSLEVVSNSNDPGIKAEASWYLALCYLRLDDAAAARKYLNSLVVAGSFYSDEATLLLSELN